MGSVITKIKNKINQRSIIIQYLVVLGLLGTIGVSLYYCIIDFNGFKRSMVRLRRIADIEDDYVRKLQPMAAAYNKEEFIKATTEFRAELKTVWV